MTASPIRSYQTWTDEDDYYLENYIGHQTTSKIARRLKRTEKSIINRSSRLKLNSTTNTEGLTLLDLSETIGVSYSRVRRWSSKHGLPGKVIGRSKKITPKQFWTWLESNQELIDFSVLPKNVLIPEPSWVDVLRKLGTPTRIIERKRWSEEELASLTKMVESGETFSYMAKKINRSTNSIEKKMYDLNLYYQGKRRKPVPFSKLELTQLDTMIKEGYTVSYIAKKLNRPYSSVLRKLKDR